MLTYTTSPLVNGDAPSAVTGAPALSTTATTASNAGGYPITVSTGTLAAANYSFLYVGGTLTIQQVGQTIAFTTNAPASAAYNTSFTVAATGGASGNPVIFTSAGACSNIGSTYKMNNSTGTCSVIANQAGNTNYSMAPTVTQTVSANGPLVTVSPSNISFGTVTLGSITTKNITVTNIGTAPVTINQPLISIVQGGNSNEFVAVSLCPASLAVGNNCTITIAFSPVRLHTANCDPGDHGQCARQSAAGDADRDGSCPADDHVHHQPSGERRLQQQLHGGGHGRRQRERGDLHQFRGV